MKRNIISFLLTPFLFLLFSGCALLSQKESESGQFVLNVWNWDSFPEDIKSLVKEAYNCEKKRECRSSEKIGAVLRKCAIERGCKWSEDSILLHFTFSGDKNAGGQKEVTGMAMFVLPVGSRVIISRIQKEEDNVYLPIGVYTLNREEWANDKSKGEGGPRINGHFIIRKENKKKE